MHRRHLALGIALAVSLAVTGCAGKVRLASSRSCQAHGGTYDALGPGLQLRALIEECLGHLPGPGRLLRSERGLTASWVATSRGRREPPEAPLGRPAPRV